ncbi:MAG: hypothetical protein ACM32O_17045 [Clostridia bacterium]
MMKFKKLLLLFLGVSLFTTMTASAESSIVSNMKKLDQQRLEAEKKQECTMGCRTTRLTYMGIGPDFYELQMGDKPLTPEQEYILDKVGEILQKQAKVIEMVIANNMSPYNDIRQELKAIVLDLLTHTANMKEVSANDVKALTYAVAKARELHFDADWREGWTEDRDTAYTHQYTEGFIAVLDRFGQDFERYTDYVPAYSSNQYNWAHGFVMRSIAEFTRTMEANYPEAVKELYNTYTHKYLNLVKANQKLTLEEKVSNVTNIYNTYKTTLGTAAQSSMATAAAETMLSLIKRNNEDIGKNNERYYQDYSTAIKPIDTFVSQKEISAAYKKQLRLQWYQSFMTGLDRLDISIYKGEFYWYVDYLVTKELQPFAKAHPVETKKLAGKLLAKVKLEKNPKDKAAYNKTVAKLTKLSR